MHCPHELESVLHAIVHKIGTESERGEVASYIPGLASANLDQFGIAVCLSDGSFCEAGDTSISFSIQSIAKVFALSIALGKVGDALWHRVGREPSGTSFDSIVQLEHDYGIPRNPFINAGAIIVDDVLLGGSRPAETIAKILRFVRMLASDESIIVDKDIAIGESRTGYRNTALANYVKSFGNLHGSVEEVLGVYYHQCAIMMNCRQLACSGRYLMHGGLIQPSEGAVLTPLRARRVNALMLLCGLYEGAGDFAFRVGLPGKSGVGGGLLAIVPGKASIALWSPGLDRCGNSLLGISALENLVEKTGWSAF